MFLVSSLDFKAAEAVCMSKKKPNKSALAGPLCMNRREKKTQARSTEVTPSHDITQSFYKTTSPCDTPKKDQHTATRLTIISHYPYNYNLHAGYCTIHKSPRTM
jgi:hypothetical protein